MSPLVIALLVLGAPATPSGEAALDCDAPYPLTQKNRQMTAALRASLTEAGFSKLLKAKRLGVAVVDLTPKTRIHYAGLNDDEMMYAASLPKIIALLGVVQAAREGRIPWEAQLEAKLGRMINASSNRDASWAVKKAGLDYLATLVQRPGYCFYGRRHGGLWLGRAFEKGGPSKRDPLEGLSHAATARQVARFYTLLDKGLLVGPRGNARILKLMGDPAIFHKFIKGLPDAAFVARKSGSWRTFHSDSAIIEHDGIRYVAVVISDDRAGSRHLPELIKLVDAVVVSGRHRVAPSTPQL